MPLTNAQFDSIKRIYDERVMENQAEMDRRRAYVEANVDGYRELDEAIASMSVQYARKKMQGESVFA